ncbi:MAG TPA: single-stranded DNA-binding protein [Candidatus Omnitrophota bacterium]|jgi:single-strand DNA-binding protein|nr:single-stranded DNA-binding protein [Candidatus Omnitrophota bacterium]HSA30697.1 single-stranded DNA-binding protein [Candidatus Omnitrophota bacterium]
MANLNKTFLIGNLTRDPELRYTPAGVPVANLGLAVNRRFRDKTGELKEDVCFLTVTVWDKQAEACCQHLKKGSPIFVEGVLQSRSWETTDGQKRSTIDVRAERVQFLGKFSPGQGEDGSGDGLSLDHSADDQAIMPEDVAWDE